MINFILRRLLISIFVLLGISMVSFAVIQLPPGDFASSYKSFLTNQGGMSEEEAERAANIVRARYGLDQPVPIQYFNWIKGIVTKGEFGLSFAYRKDVGELIAERLPRTLLLALMAHAVSSGIGLLVGIYVASRQYGLADNLSAVLAFIFTAVPRFWLALVIICILVFTFKQEHIFSFFSPQYVAAPWSWAKLADFTKHIWPVVFLPAWVAWPEICGSCVVICWMC